MHSLQNEDADVTSDHEDADADMLLDYKKAIRAVRRKQEARSAQASSGAENDAIVLVSEDSLIPLHRIDVFAAARPNIGDETGCGVYTNV